MPRAARCPPRPLAALPPEPRRALSTPRGGLGGGRGEGRGPLRAVGRTPLPARGASGELAPVAAVQLPQGGGGCVPARASSPPTPHLTPRAVTGALEWTRPALAERWTGARQGVGAGGLGRSHFPTSRISKCIIYEPPHLGAPPRLRGIKAGLQPQRAGSVNAPRLAGLAELGGTEKRGCLA